MNAITAMKIENLVEKYVEQHKIANAIEMLKFMYENEMVSKEKAEKSFELLWNSLNK